MKIEESDMISELPEPLLHHILSFLPFKEVVRSSILSKTWQRAWLTIPVLLFDHTFFYGDLRDYKCFDIECNDDNGNQQGVQEGRHTLTIPVTCTRIEKLFNYVEQTLRNRYREMIILNRFVLEVHCSIVRNFTSFVDRCLSLAVQSGVEELQLRFTWVYGWVYDLPQAVLCSKSIHSLKLSCCKLVLPENKVILPRLRKLSLYCVYTDNNAIENLVAHCPFIEYLSLDFCQGFKSLELLGPNKLHEIKLWENNELERVKIEASNVQSVYIGGLVEIFLTSYTNLKRLLLFLASITDEWLCYQIPNFPNLEFLGLFDCDNLKSITISSHSLKRLYIEYCGKLVKVKIKTPNLSMFRYAGDLISFLSDASTSVETHLGFYSKNIDTKWYARCVEVLTQFHRFSKVLNLESDMSEALFVPCELRQILPPPFSGSKHVRLLVNTREFGFLIRNIVDALLWISPHAETVSIKCLQCTICFKFFYSRELICEGESPCCCKSLPVSCWQQCMKKVEYEIANCDLQKGNNVKRFTFEGEGIWDSIDGLSLTDLLIF